MAFYSDFTPISGFLNLLFTKPFLYLCTKESAVKNTPISKFIQAGEWQKAFSAARKFFFGLTKEQKRSIEIAADCCNELRRPFYASIGIDWADETEMAKSFLLAKFG